MTTIGELKAEAARLEKIAIAEYLPTPDDLFEGITGPAAPDHDTMTETFGAPELYAVSIDDARKMFEPPEPKDVKIAIADEAKNIVAGARRAAYGKPEQNFERIARFWDAYFRNRGVALLGPNGENVKITAADVSPMMRLMKEARLCETPDHRDSFVDLVGYTLTGAEVNGVKA